MKNFNQGYQGLLVLVLILVIIVMAVFTFRNWPVKCSEVDLINTSLTIKSGDRKFVGMNADIDSLRFGKVSPEAIVRRTVKVEYDQAGEVLVSMESDFSSWTVIKPFQFEVAPQERKEVSFEVHPPKGARNAEMTGVVKFCFKKS